MPPSEPTHGGVPAPRHGAGGGCTCAQTAIAPSNSAPSAIIANLRPNPRSALWLFISALPGNGAESSPQGTGCQSNASQHECGYARPQKRRGPNHVHVQPCLSQHADPELFKNQECDRSTNQQIRGCMQRRGG